ncbi:MAG: hypothetical protein DWQ47_02275 [Acidobacteria bacterium]|nr:MAG: hypothetical protein DWQ32_05825 [Acidobacteriota bacterium]REK01245.1 MAG: hypothetical protein DWQ38_02260 [Acidobacteriota bacterium]REK14201.1 MAG: hypothetical protein DWQ43_11515 [Acidobacteriota bacterium]REK44916.1 MAG: hypothetical protein DWQ47_02275 [Acidobacteriota bacterium]
MMNRPILILILISLLVPAAAFAQKNARNSSEKRFSDDSTVFGRVEALSEGNGVFVRWETSLERDNLGFEVYRNSGSGWERVSRAFIPGGLLKHASSKNRTYSYFDPEGHFGSMYVISSRHLDGGSQSTKVVHPSYEASLYSKVGRSSESMKKAAESAEPVTERYSPATDPRSRQGLGSTTLPPDIDQQFWVASQPGVKIGVKETGLYRVSRTELENAGFDVNTDESLWQLYLNGNQQAIIVGQNGDFIEFYGKALDARSTDTNVYFLVVGNQAGNRMANIVRKSNGSNTASNYRENYYKRDRLFYVSDVRNGDLENFFGGVISSTASNVIVNFDSVDHNSLKTYIQINVQGFTPGTHKVAVSVNGTSLGSFSFSGMTAAVADIGVPTSIINEGANTISLQGTGSPPDISFLFDVSAQYPRSYVARNDELLFPVPLNKQVTVTNFTDPTVRVFDLTSADSPALITNTSLGNLTKLGTDFQVTIPSNNPSTMFAVSEAGVRTVDQIVLNNPSTLADTANSAEMVILSHADWLTESESWATYRTTEGINSVAVDVEDVFDEFGFGIRSSDAIKEFINYSRLNWSGAPGYIMLAGDASYDPRNYTGAGGGDHVPTDLIETVRGESASDESLADYDGNGLSEVAIARIPANNPAQITNALAKVMAFEASVTNAPLRGSLCASDIPDVVNFEDICERVLDELPATIPFTSVNRADNNANATLISEMNSGAAANTFGKYIVNYTGHGSVVGWTQVSFFRNNHVSQLDNSDDLTIFTMLTCLNGYFTDPSGTGLAETLIHRVGGGAVATWASTGETTPDVQEILATKFYDELGNNPQVNRIGDLVKSAKTAVQSSADVRLSWALFADPAMKVK